MHILITGASGSGTTTLGEALASSLGLPHLDADNFYWLPTSPPFKQKRDPKYRFNLLHQELHAVPGVILSGSIVDWGSEIENSFTLIVFLYLSAELRVERLRRRELERYGKVNEAFIKWASEYDSGPSEGRSLAKHESWLAQRRCPVLRLEGDLSIEERVARVLRVILEPG